MKLKNIFTGICLLIIILSCGRSKNIKDILLNSEGKEWRLEEFNGKKNLVDDNRIFLIFHKDYTYEIFYKHDGERVFFNTDNIITPKWDVNSNIQLNMSSFPNLELIKFQNNILVFKSGRETYKFICTNRTSKYLIR